MVRIQIKGFHDLEKGQLGAGEKVVLSGYNLKEGPFAIGTVVDGNFGRLGTRMMKCFKRIMHIG